MKIYKKLLYAMFMIGSMTLTGCDDFLTPDNKSSVTDTDYFSTASGFQSLVYDAYAQLIYITVQMHRYISMPVPTSIKMDVMILMPHFTVGQTLHLSMVRLRLFIPIVMMVSVLAFPSNTMHRQRTSAML